MSALTLLLERLRRHRPPPGAPGTLAVPPEKEDLAAEVAFLFAELDAVSAKAREVRAAAQAGAGAAHADARNARERVFADASRQAELLASQLLDKSRAAYEREAATLIAEAHAEAERVLARGRDSTPALVAEVVRRVGGQQR